MSLLDAQALAVSHFSQRRTLVRSRDSAHPTYLISPG